MCQIEFQYTLMCINDEYLYALIEQLKMRRVLVIIILGIVKENNIFLILGTFVLIIT